MSGFVRKDWNGVMEGLPCVFGRTEGPDPTKVLKCFLQSGQRVWTCPRGCFQQMIHTLDKDANCPCFVRGQGAKWCGRDQLQDALSRDFLRLSLLRLYGLLCGFSLITQRSVVQIHPPQPNNFLLHSGLGVEIS